MREKTMPSLPQTSVIKAVMCVERTISFYRFGSSLLENPKYIFYCSFSYQAKHPKDCLKYFYFTLQIKRCIVVQITQNPRHYWCDYITQHFQNLHLLPVFTLVLMPSPSFHRRKWGREMALQTFFQ